MTVLVLTCEEDLTADIVVSTLQDLGVPLVRLDPADLPGRVSLSAEYTGGDFHGYLKSGERMVSLSSLRSVWVRRPGTPGARTAEQSAWITIEAEQALYGMLTSTQARWMNHPVASAQARYKPWQLRLAHRSGFLVPATLLTTFPSMARQFAAAHQDLVVKSVSGKHPGDPPMVLPTTRISPDTDFSGVAAGPTLLQQHIPKEADIRLTCVGDHLFAARKKADPEEVDSRFTHHGTWEPVEVPDAIHRGVNSYMSAAQLAYGAFDFAEDPDGAWWFLECNQGGQFGFVQLETDQPIAQAIATWLAVEP
ncbi:ATP-grasp ribosomal peptide maturase [Streptomyces sp. Je 1-4]|uniref:ATP-grasp ribosomal peptide maturase n=1 Tax=Streptomyces TaxID=1883 RepID=UPI00140ED6BE|nr:MULTISPECIES: ATP-grasp ribosomal peptide maturase [unclassified Streptomyces]QIK04936.1 ATP-grasp ribosomal peptide maturase [Streptomyces sp. ID38640]UYB38104.1 ATP-grasp ribosomal peptide maturase [Streptomyces sp. Je 1-4]UZQ34041.1 ATP-grasp ribosomal peptide maturase [Streptomyces sp. Je 1-4] [Streptomyces sp. Je 1-4 4N24]UZQ41459.1 ATP-grasp ribosomal peptide maturase [Streptomyces sp. Je 1-4] [Streptomyces sp. Je 1-4 4N24_ara]